MVHTPQHFLAKPEGIPLFEGQKNFLDFVYFTNFYYENQRRTLPSVYNEQNQSTQYAIQLRARARELARLRLFQEQIYNDFSIDITRSEFMYRNFGYLLKLKDPFFFNGKSDAFYRRFIQALSAVLFRGTTKSAIVDGLKIFLEGIPFTFTQMYLDRLKKGEEGDKRYKNIFKIVLDMDNAKPGADFSFAMEGLQFFLEIMKPAHNHGMVYWGLGDKFNLQGGCEPIYDLIEGEINALSITIDPVDGVEIASIVGPVVTLVDDTVLLVLDTTNVIDENEDLIDYNDLAVGMFVTYVGDESTGRFQYWAPIERMPPDLWFTSKGYPRTPLLSEADTAFKSRADFNHYVKKNKSHGFDAQVKAPGALCERLNTKIYTWHYEDFRKCGLPKETYVDKENVSTTYNPTDQTIKVLRTPVVKGIGDYVIADPTDVTVYVNNVIVSVADISVFTGLITLTNAAPINAVIEVSYTYSSNVNYTLDDTMDGELFNQTTNVLNSNVSNYGSVLTQGFVPTVKATKWKTNAFLLKGSSLENIPYTLEHNNPAQYGHKFNQARVVKNYTEMSCKVFSKTEALGLNTDGECLNYPTPPVQLRFDVNAPQPDPWIILPGSDLFNETGELLNDAMLLNDVYRVLYYGPYSKKYSFFDIETEECGGELIPRPFCDDLHNGFKLHIAGNDYTDRYVMPPELDVIIFNNTETLENEDIFSEQNRTKLDVFVHEVAEEQFDPPTESFSITDIGLDLHDTYKMVPKNIMIHNDAVSDYPGGNPTSPVYGFDPDYQNLNNGIEFNDDMSMLNEANIIQIGTTPNELEVQIPPSRVHPIDGQDVVPPGLKSGPGDTNYIFLVRERFDEDLTDVDITTTLEDQYQYVQDRFALNNYPDFLNIPLSYLNSNFEHLSWSFGMKAADNMNLSITDSFVFSAGYSEFPPPPDDTNPISVEINDYWYQFVLNDSRLELNDDRMELNDSYSRRLLETTYLMIA